MDKPPIAITYRGVTYKRNPNGKQRAHRVYYAAPRGCGRDYLHRDIWRDHNGRDIPDGWHIHHTDEDPFNNDPSNLKLLSPAEHAQEHAEQFSDRRREWINSVRPLAAEWHRSEEGRAWHREHGKRTWEDRQPEHRKTCESCGEEFSAWFDDARYCSRRCINRAREAKYREMAPCPICEAEFSRDRYRKRPETCSRKCGAALRRQRAV